VKGRARRPRREAYESRLRARARVRACVRACVLACDSEGVWWGGVGARLGLCRAAGRGHSRRQ
jgi:hypothetical protein